MTDSATQKQWVADRRGDYLPDINEITFDIYFPCNYN